MSLGCSWEVVNPTPPGTSIPVGFKYAIAQYWFGHDGTLRGETELGEDDLGYLQGLRDAGTGDVAEGAGMLIAAIQAHGRIIFRIGPG